MFQRLITNLKYYFDSNLQLDKNHDLNEICQFLLPSTNIDHDLYKKSGLLVARNILDIKEIDLWRTNIENEICKKDYKFLHNKKNYWLTNLSNLSVGTDIISNKAILNILDELIGTERVFVGHDSVSVDYSVPGLHDDQNSHRQLFGEEVYEDFSTTRVLFNLNSLNSIPQRFGFVPGSHLRATKKIDYDFAKRNIEWVDVSHGSVVFFDPRVIHSAVAGSQKKYMVVLTYDNENKYVKDIYDYTFRERGQGTGPKEELFWKKLDEKSLKPKFIDSFNEL